MAYATQPPKTDVAIYENIKITYAKRRYFFGIVSWWEKVSEESIGKDLVIRTTEKYDSIILNGISVI